MNLFTFPWKHPTQCNKKELLTLCAYLNINAYKGIKKNELKTMILRQYPIIEKYTIELYYQNKYYYIPSRIKYWWCFQQVHTGRGGIELYYLQHTKHQRSQRYCYYLHTNQWTKTDSFIEQLVELYHHTDLNIARQAIWYLHCKHVYAMARLLCDEWIIRDVMIYMMRHFMTLIPCSLVAYKII